MILCKWQKTRNAKDLNSQTVPVPVSRQDVPYLWYPEGSQRLLMMDILPHLLGNVQKQYPAEESLTNKQ